MFKEFFEFILDEKGWGPFNLVALVLMIVFMIWISVSVILYLNISLLWGLSVAPLYLFFRFLSFLKSRPKKEEEDDVSSYNHF